MEGRIVRIGKAIGIESINGRYDLAVPASAWEATEHALASHPRSSGDRHSPGPRTAAGGRGSIADRLRLSR